MTPQERAMLEQRLQALRTQLAQLDPEESAKMGGEMALEGASTPEKIAINLGAGMNNLWTGAKQLFGGGPSDDELLQDRARNAAAAESQTGGELTQIAGEIIPSLAIPAGGFVGSARGIANLGRMAVGNAPMKMMVPARLGSAASVADMAMAGTALGALQPTTSDESTSINAALGGVGGAALPVLFGVPKAVTRLMTNKGAQSRAGGKIIGTLGGEDAAKTAVQQIKNYKPGAFVSYIPMSTNEILQNTKLGVAQRGAALFDPAGWADLMAAQSSGRYAALREATSAADKLQPLREARDAATATLREQALSKAAKDPWFHEPVVKTTLSVLKGGSGSSPSVQKVAGYVLDELGNGITPERLYTVRKTLTNGLSKPESISAPNPLTAAVKQADVQSKSLIGAIDDSLNAASGGKWDKYLEKYQDLSRPVVSARAEAAIRDQFEREGAALVRGLSEDVPAITGRSLGRAVEKFGQNSFGDTLSYGSRDALNQLQNNIARSETIQALIKKAGTSGGGSNTMMDLFANAAAQNRISRGGQVLHWLVGHSKDMTRQAMSDALQNPDTFVRVVEGKLRQGKPLTDAEHMVLNTIRAGSGSILLGDYVQ